MANAASTIRKTSEFLTFRPGHLKRASWPEKDTLRQTGHIVSLDSMEPGSVESNVWRPSPQNAGVKANAHGHNAAGYATCHICNLGMFERWFWFGPLNETPSLATGRKKTHSGLFVWAVVLVQLIEQDPRPCHFKGATLGIVRLSSGFGSVDWTRPPPLPLQGSLRSGKRHTRDHSWFCFRSLNETPSLATGRKKTRSGKQDILSRWILWNLGR
jgi:hypothetical protein